MRGYIDPVRYISNRSTGRLGAYIATEALKRNASVTFIHGTGSVIPDVSFLGKGYVSQLTCIEIETFDDLLTTIREKLMGISFHAIVHSMAVLDYIPEKYCSSKISSGEDKLETTFVRTLKIIKVIRDLWPHALLVGFKLEVGLSKNELIEKAYKSLHESKANLVVANDHADIAGDKHRAYVINSGKEVECECTTKKDISEKLIDIIVKLL